MVLARTLSATLLLFFYFSSAYSLRIGTYNVENLWSHIPKKTPAAYPAYREKSSNWFRDEMWQAKVQNLVKVIQWAQEPDILCLQELEHKSPIWEIPYGDGRTFRQALEELGYRYFLLGEQEPGRDVVITTGIISKIPFYSIHPVGVPWDSRVQSARNIQVGAGMVQGQRLIIYNAHFPSAQVKNSESYKLSLRKRLRERLEEESRRDPGVRMVLLGDFNGDIYEDGFSNLWGDIPQDRRWESMWNGSGRSLSHMLLSSQFFLSSGLLYKHLSFRIIGQDGEARQHLLTEDGVPYRWQKEFQGHFYTHMGVGYSDHLPLVAEFYFEKKESASESLGIPGGVLESPYGELLDGEW
jgi:exonuclease III